ncbi:hypothetical protein JCM10212_004367 [Sporobolomyces blumeae]
MPSDFETSIEKLDLVSSSPSDLETSIQRLLDEAVSRKVAPGLVATVFDDKDAIATACAGSSSLSSPDAKLTLDTVMWPASGGKPLVSLLALQLVEKHGFDVDSHAELVEVLPELGKDWPGTRIWQIIDGKDENGEYTYREAKVGITLRHCLTHTIGSGLHFNSEPDAKFFAETAKSGKTNMSGYIEAFNQPRMFEAGEGFAYGLGAEWVGLFVQRLGGKTFRETARELLYEPLGLEPDTIETCRTSAMNDKLAEIVIKLQDGSFVPLPTPFDTPQYEEEPPHGRTVLGNAPFWTTFRTYCQVLRSFLNKSAPGPGGKPLLSEPVFDKAFADDLKRRGVDIKQDPFMITTNPMMTHEIKYFSKANEGEDDTVGFNMFQQAVHRANNAYGFRPNVAEWSGVANTYYMVDPERKVGAAVSAQFFPFGDADMLLLKDTMFKLVHEYAARKSKAE